MKRPAEKYRPVRERTAYPYPVKHPDRRLPTQSCCCGQKGSGPGVRMQSPGTGNRLKQFLWDTEKQSHQSARGDHENIKNPREPGGSVCCKPEPAEFSCHPCAEILEHFFVSSDMRQRKTRIYICRMVAVMPTGSRNKPGEPVNRIRRDKVRVFCRAKFCGSIPVLRADFSGKPEPGGRGIWFWDPDRPGRKTRSVRPRVIR
jgi:hypothetical protein